MTLTDVVILGLAFSSLVDIWLNGSLFRNTVERLKQHATPEDSDIFPSDVEVVEVSPPRTCGFESMLPPRIAELLTCHRCLGFQLCFWGLLLLCLSAGGLGTHERPLMQSIPTWVSFVLYVLALHRIGTVLWALGKDS